MAEFVGRVHFDNGRFRGNACGNHLSDTVRLSSDPSETTCENCKGTAVWREAAGVKDEPRRRTYRYVLYLDLPDGGGKLWSKTPFGPEAHEHLAEIGATVRKDVDLEAEDTAPKLTACACEKVRYRSERAATKTALRRSAKAGHGLRVYRCPTERGVWHLTKNPLREVA